MALVPLLAAARLSAQSVRGIVADQYGAPLAGVVVLLVNESDVSAGRSLTDAQGTFRITAPAGSYRLRTLRIGFRPTTSARMTLSIGEERTQRIELAGIPLSLDTVRVAERSSCRTPTDSGLAVSIVWYQARTALIAAQLSAGTRALTATTVTYERTLDPKQERILGQRSFVSSGTTRSPWTSPSPDSLRRSGYVVSNLDGTITYWAPDLNVLSSDAFVEDNCFRLASSGEAGIIGVSFEPRPERRNVAGIRGTLWLERETAELRRMEFRYANASEEQEAGDAGGHMAFVRLTNGSWIISSWRIRMPVIDKRQVRVSGIKSTATSVETMVTAIKLEGGELALVTRYRDTLWARPASPLAGTILDSSTNAGIPGAEIKLKGTELQTTSGATGAFRIADMLPGNYMVEIRTPPLSAIGAVHTIPVTFIDSTTPLIARVPTALQVVSASCTTRRPAILAGTVQHQNGTPAPNGSRVVAEWSDSSAFGKRYASIETRTDARGAFRLCEAPAGTMVAVYALSDSGRTQSVNVRVPAVGQFATVPLKFDPGRTSATLSGFILSDVNGQPLADVEVAMPALSRNVFANERGAFRIDEIPAGTHALIARKIGYRQLVTSITFRSNDRVERSFLLARAHMLDTVSVQASGVSRDFEDNRKLGLGRFITRAQIDSLQGQSISRLLFQFPSVSLISGGGQAWVLSKRAPGQLHVVADPGSVRRGDSPSVWCGQIGSKPACGCFPKVYVDNQLMNQSQPTEPFDVNSIPSAAIEAVEWYAGPSQTPAKYSTLNSVCGVLVIHTRRGRS